MGGGRVECRAADAPTTPTWRGADAGRRPGGIREDLDPGDADPENLYLLTDASLPSAASAGCPAHWARRSARSTPIRWRPRCSATPCSTRSSSKRAEWDGYHAHVSAGKPNAISGSGARRPDSWEELTSAHLADRLDGDPECVALMPVGATEQHGPAPADRHRHDHRHRPGRPGERRHRRPGAPGDRRGRERVARHRPGRHVRGDAGGLPGHRRRGVQLGRASGVRRLLFVNGHVGNTAALSIALDRVRTGAGPAGRQRRLVAGDARRAGRGGGRRRRLARQPGRDLADAGPRPRAGRRGRGGRRRRPRPQHRPGAALHGRGAHGRGGHRPAVGGHHRARRRAARRRGGGARRPCPPGPRRGAAPPAPPAPPAARDGGAD